MLRVRETHAYVSIRVNSWQKSVVDPRQTRRRDCLPDTFALFVGQMQRNFLRQFGKVRAQHFLRFLDDEITAHAGSDASEHEQVPEVIQVRVMRQSVTEIDADG